MLYNSNMLSSNESSEKASILQELEELRFVGHVISVELDEDSMTELTIMEPTEKEHELFKRLRKIEREEQKQKDIFII